MAQIYSDPSREADPHALPDVEVFHIGSDIEQFEAFGDGFEPGWYWQACSPGCLPDGDPIGPFNTEDDAITDVRESYDAAECNCDEQGSAGCPTHDDDRSADAEEVQS